MKKVVVSLIVIAGSLAGIFFILNKNKAKNQSETAVVAEKNLAVAVRTANVAYQNLSLAYLSNGIFAPKQEVVISAEVPGRVARVLVSEGTIVRAGQTLAVIESDKQNVNLSNATAVYNNALAEVERFESAYQSGGVTKQQLDQIKLQLENAKNNLRSAELSASDVNVKASFAGVVNKRNVEPGSYVNPGQQMFEIVNTSSLKLKVNVDEKNIGSIKVGQQVSVTATVIPDETFNGIVTFIAPKADASLNFPVEIEIKNTGSNELKAGMYGTAKFGSEQTSQILAIPRNAFVGNISSNQVFVVQDNKAILKTVISGRNFGDYVEIISGLEDGEIVITTGQINLLNETPIEIIN